MCFKQNLGHVFVFIYCVLKPLKTEEKNKKDKTRKTHALRQTPSKKINI